ncbi:hypothetical protein EC957_006176 [Mortierella hygrophila]|uniref:Uncharacterized protein n=1 Tax=Mortierella hygrophila TaxID=979708 RepID=A0A9P6EYE8_9FUNG|nr:hypothetical protein EC957_006176 [Mortierella hygrophila]
MLLIKTVALLCSATAVMAANSVASGAIFVGKDTSDSSASPIDVYSNPSNHATAAASVLVFAAKSVNFHPSSQEPKALGQNLEQFQTKVTSFPGFVLQDIQDYFLGLDGSLTQFEKTIGEQLDDPNIARALRGLVPDNVEDQSSTDWVLSLIVLSKPAGTNTVNVKLVQVSLIISSDGNTATIPEQSARLVVSDLQVAERVFVLNAETFADRIPTTSVSDFINFFTSPKDFSRRDQAQRGSASCLRNRMTFKDRQAILSWIH